VNSEIYNTEIVNSEIYNTEIVNSEIYNTEIVNSDDSGLPGKKTKSQGSPHIVKTGRLDFPYFFHQ
jgi:hypothetical protein